MNSLDRKSNIEQTVNQLILTNIYKKNLSRKKSLLSINEVGFSIYSQTDEDGILLYIFSLIGIHKKQFVEIGLGRNLECNCSNLAINFGWYGLFIDGDKETIKFAEYYFNNNSKTKLFPPKLSYAWVTKDNINGIIKDAGFSGEIDLLSIDIDGMDFWVWKAITCINPRVVVIEANAKFGLRSITVPYDQNWTYKSEQYPHYHGASLPAIVKLGKQKGYRLVGTNRYGYNAFFVRNDIGNKLLPAVTVASCRKHPTRENDKKIFAEIQNLPFVKI